MSLIQFSELLAQLKGYDLVFADNSLFGCGNLLKEKVGIPMIVDYSAWGFNDAYNWQYGISWPISYVPAQPIHITKEGISFHLRCLNLLAYVYTRLFGQALTVVGTSALKTKYNLAPDKSFTQLVAETDLVLVPLHWALEWSRPVPPSKFYHSYISSLNILFEFTTIYSIILRYKSDWTYSPKASQEIASRFRRFHAICW